ncbi:MAG: nuclear transport factor 2 family protein [Hyphomicrobiales bacterium]|nr:nuclear transport factor 2 family protein [Hyphomicrobiales bacterium]
MTSSLTAFMETYKRAWENRDDALLCSLFAPDGVYHNTPFDAQTGHDAITRYWDRVKLQDDIHFSYAIVSEADNGGVATWTTRYRVTSEKMFDMWAKSAGTGMVNRRPGDPLPRLRLEGIAVVDLDDDGLCRHFRLWWHSQPDD